MITTLRQIARFLALVALCASARATVTVNASLTDAQGNAQQYAFLKLHLNYCGYNVPEVAGGSYSIVAKDLVLLPSQLPATIYGNNEITCGNSYSTLWHVTAYLDSSTPIAGDLDYDLCSTTTNCADGIATIAWNLNGAMPFNLGPNSPPAPGFQTIFGNPSGSQAITQLAGGSGATASATQSGGVINTCTASGGTGYLSPPALQVIGGGGSGAILLATVAAGAVTGCTIVNAGTGFTTTPTVKVYGGSSLAIVGVLDLSNATVIYPSFLPGSAAGSPGQVQFNSAGGFGASANLTWNSGSNTLSATNVTGTNVSVLGKAVFSGLSPWVDVTSSTYGAKCDGSTDDTTAFQNAINAAASGNVNASLVYVPVGTAGMCIVAGQLNADATSNVAIVGGSNQNWGNGTLKPAIRFTGSTAPLISAKSSVGFSIINMTIQYSNGAFSGNVVDISHGGSGIDSSGTIFQNNDFTGLGGIAVSAACLISGDKANSVQVFHNTFNFAVTPICGAASGGSYANGWFIWNNEFGAASGTLSGTYIKGMKDGATVVGNVAENPTGNLMDNSTVPCTGCVIQFDVEDEAAGYSGTYFNGNFSGSTFAGGFYQGGSSALGTFLSMPSGSSGISVKGASLRNLAVAFVFNSSNQTNIDFTGNQYSAITSFSTNFPASGVWDDNTGAKRYFGLVQFPGNTITTNGTAVNSGTCQSQPPITLTGVAGTGSKVAWALSGAPPATWQTGITVLPAVTANTVTLWLCNPTAGNITPAAQVVNVNVTQ